ncbi:MAG: sigma-70 family RNA polymerase sigma factor [Planctomycetota bacterium]
MTTVNPDDDLLTRMRAGNEEAFAEFVRSHSGRMLVVAKRILRDDEAAADAVQEGFLLAFRSLDRFGGQSSLGTWLHRIVVNASLTKLRTRTRRPEILIDDLLPKFDQTGHHVEPVNRWSGPSDEPLQREELRVQIRESIDRLPEDFRVVVLLRDIEGLDTDQTAELLQVSTSVVKTRLHRARQALRTLLEPLFIK